MILSPEQTAVVVRHMRSSLMSKAVHVSYTAEKCFRLREGLSAFSWFCWSGQCF